MRLTLQRRLAAYVLGVSEKRVRFDPSRLEDIKEAITRTDMRGLVGEGAAWALPEKGVSRGRVRVAKSQKSKGLRKGRGSRKGKSNARASTKTAWINRVRLQRKYIHDLRHSGSVTPETARVLYGRAKGGFFRSKTPHKNLCGRERAAIQAAGSPVI